MKKVLIIAYIFPPIGGSGVQRTTKFVKYLPQFDWQPVVVCGDDGDVFEDGYDQSLLQEIPTEAKIWRTHFISPLGFRRWMHKRISRGGIADLRYSPHNQSIREERTIKGKGKIGRKLFTTLSKPLSPFEFPPIDAALYWAISIVPLCLRIIKKEKVDLIFSTSFPYSDHVTGYLLKRITGKPWVADFRDPWTGNASRGNTGWRRKCDSWVEKRILNYADRIISVTPTYTREIHKIVPSKPAGKFVTIENGYDDVDFGFTQLDRKKLLRNGRKVLSHVGKIYDGTAVPFLLAAQKLTEEEQAQLEIHFIGGLPPQERQWVDKNPLAWKMVVTERVPHPQAINELRNADLLILPVGITSRWEGHYPGKLFEYMRSGTPILMIGPEGDTARLILKSGCGCFIDAKRVDEITKFLSRLVNWPDQYIPQFFQPKQEVIAKYDRRFLTRRLTKVFSELTSETELNG